MILQGTLHNQDANYGRKLYDVDQSNFYASLLFETELSKQHSLSAGLSFNYDGYDQNYRLTNQAEEGEPQIKSFTRNLSLITQSCVLVDAIVVSEIKERLSPKNEPPTTMATIYGRSIPVFSASPMATGVSATIVPTLVPMESEMKQGGDQNSSQ